MLRVSSGFPNTRKQQKHEAVGVFGFVFGNHDETLALDFEILQYLQLTSRIFNVCRTKLLGSIATPPGWAVSLLQVPLPQQFCIVALIFSMCKQMMTSEIRK